MTHHPDRAAQMREACARLAKNGAVAAFQQATEAQGDEVLYHTRTDVFDAIGKALSECQRQIEHLPLPGEAPDAAARPAPCIPASDGGEDEGVSDAGNIHVKPPRPCPDCDDTGWSLGDPCAVCQGPSKGAALRHVYENEKRTPAPTRPANDAGDAVREAVDGLRAVIKARRDAWHAKPFVRRRRAGTGGAPVTHPTDRAEAMREACAKVCEENGVVTTPQGKRLAPDRYKPTGAVHEGMVYAAAIRAIPLPARADAVEEAARALIESVPPDFWNNDPPTDDTEVAYAIDYALLDALRAALRRAKGGA